MLGSFTDMRRQEAASPDQEVVQEDSRQHGGEEESRVVVVHVQHTPHGPERDVMESPPKEKPSSSSKSFLPLLALGLRLLPATLLLESVPGVDSQEDDEEENVAPPDDGVTKQVDTGLVIPG